MNLSSDCDLLCISCHLATRTPFGAGLAQGEFRAGHYPDNQALTLSAEWSCTDEFSMPPCFARLCVSQAAVDDPCVHYHHRHNAEYNQVFHLVISLFDWCERDSPLWV